MLARPGTTMLRSGLPRARRAAVALVLTCAIASPVSGFAASHVAAAESRAVVKDPLASVADTALMQLSTFLVTQRDTDLALYQRTRAAVVTEVSKRLLLDPQRLEDAWAAADYSHQTAIMAALSQVGTPYRRNMSEPGVGFDCSGLTTYAWGRAGLPLPRQSSAQIRAAEPRALETAMAGDLVQYPGHVMMYLGVDRAIVHAIRPGRPVEVDYIMPGRRDLKFGHPR